MQNLWRELYQELTTQHRPLATDAELRLTGLMTSPSSEIAKAKLGQYLQEAQRAREKNQLQDSLILVLVSGEYYWRKHQPTRAAGLLLEASDLFYLLQLPEISYRCLSAALDLVKKKIPLVWWEYELLGNIFLFTASLAILNAPATLSQRLTHFRKALSKTQQSQVSREDGYRVATALRRAYQRRSLVPLDELDTKTTLRSQAESTTLYEYLTGEAERYILIRDGLTALRRETQQED